MGRDVTEKDHNEEVEPTEGTTTDADLDAESDDEVTGEVAAAEGDEGDDASDDEATAASDESGDDSPSMIEEVAAAAGVSSASQEQPEPVKFAHIIGYSTPDDEVSKPSTGDPLNRTDDQLRDMGVESDAMPMGVLLATGIAIVVLLVAIFVGVGELFGNVARDQLYDEAWAGTDPRHDRLMETERADLTTPGVIEVEDGPTEYRLPIDQAMAIVAANPALLGGHPLGESPEPPAVPAADAAPEPTAPARIQIAPSGETGLPTNGSQLRLVAPDGARPADTIRLVPSDGAADHDHDGDGHPDH